MSGVALAESSSHEIPYVSHHVQQQSDNSIEAPGSRNTPEASNIVGEASNDSTPQKGSQKHLNDSSPDSSRDSSRDPSLESSRDPSRDPSEESSRKPSQDLSVNPPKDSPKESSDSSAKDSPSKLSTTESGNEPGSPQLHRRNTPHIQVRPGATICQNCFTTTTPLWRRDENGQIMCNACGLFLKLHGRRRPISLKTDVIKSRNRGNRQHRMERVERMVRAPPRKKTQVGTPVVIQTVHSQNLAIRQAQQAQQEAQQEAQRQARIQYRQANMNVQQPLQGLPPPPAQPGMPQIIPHALGGMPQIPPPMMYAGGAPGYLGAQHGGAPANPSHPHMMLNSPVLDPKDPRMSLASPLALAPLGQPLSPQIIAHTGGGPMMPSRMPPRGTMSELLLPCSPDLTDRIPHLAQVPVSQFQQSQNQSREQAGNNEQPAQQQQQQQRDSDSVSPLGSPKGAQGDSPTPVSESTSRSALMTKVSELELVNDLLMRRVRDLESSEQRSKREIEELRAQLRKQEESSNSQPVSANTSTVA